MKTRAIYWLKRDFRLTDNPALTAALNTCDEVVPLFILEPSALSAPETSAFHVHAQCDAFNGLALHLRSRLKKNTDPVLGFCQREVVETLDLLYAAAPFTHLFSHQETGGQRTYDRDKAVAHWCKDNGVSWSEHLQTGVFRGRIDRDKRHKDWELFYKTPVLPIPEKIQNLKIPEEYSYLCECANSRKRTAKSETFLKDTWYPAPGLYGTLQVGPLHPADYGFPLTPEQRHYVQPVSEQAAATTLKSFLTERALDYSKGMSSPNSAFYRCSRLSVHFAWGTMSGRQAYQAVHAAIEEWKESDAPNAGTWRKNLRSFASRLHWRDHFTQRLETEVEMELRPLNPNFWELELENDTTKFEAWLTGRTGFPMVDACIRCMAVTGYINFRMRAMLTSTATHMLHLDFRSIDKPMARLYTDYEPGIHLAQLQMQAGMVGINTLRTYSPEKQILDQDPDCVFIHRWIPELREFTAKEITCRDLAAGLGDYPPAIVDRTESIKVYRKLIGDLKFQPGGREITETVYAKHGSRRSPARKKKASSKKSSSEKPTNKQSS